VSPPGIKFFTKTGGLKKPDITSILTFAAEHCAESPYEDFTWDGLSRPVKLDFMPTYAAHLRHLIMEGVDHPASFSQPLKVRESPSFQRARALRLQQLQKQPSYCTAMQKLRIVTLGISGGRALTRPFRDARRFPSTRL
jgi:hypothetical protein